ncbi:MAG: STAS domain-containing protein [Deltaproteobacteria bacterium]
MAQGPLDLQIRNVRNVVIVDLDGRLIMGEAEMSLRAAVHSLLDGGTKNLALNLSEIKYIDSSGIGSLAAVWTTSKKAGANCRLFAIPTKVKLMLKISRLDTVFQVLEDEASALSSFSTLSRA